MPGIGMANRPRSARKTNIERTEIIVVGNGPSAVTLSYLLSGHWPYHNGNQVYNEYLNYKLNDAGDESIIEQDLDYLSEGLEGRSTNQVALLLDHLQHPNADLGSEEPSTLEWRYNETKKIKHIVLGQGLPGGVWQTLTSGFQTLSLGNWMELPNFSFRRWREESWIPNHNQYSTSTRASFAEMGAYYMDYVTANGLSDYFYNHHKVTSVERVLLPDKEIINNESGELENNQKPAEIVWEVRGKRLNTSETNQLLEEDFIYHSNGVVLATGVHDSPQELDAAGAGCEFVYNSIHLLESAVESGKVKEEMGALVVVGAGLSAADAILLAEKLALPVVHVFRKEANDKSMIFHKLPAKMYAEYHRVHKLMKGEIKTEWYTPLEKHTVIEILPNHQLHLLCLEENLCKVIPVSAVMALIGSKPNLSFLPAEGKNLGSIPDTPIDSKHNPIVVNPFTCECENTPGLYALGPLIGDNFVRFLQGGSIGIAAHLWSDKNKKNQIVETFFNK